MKKKILIIIGSLDLGGTEKQLYSKIKSLKDSFDFYLLIFHKKGFLYKDFENLNIKIFNYSNHIEIKIFKVIKTFFKIISCIKIINPDFVHFYLPHSYILGGLSSFLFKNVKFIMSRRSMNNYQKKFFFIKFFESKILHRKMKLIVANSEFIKNQLIKEEGVEKKRIKVIYNFINPIKLKKRKSKFINILFIANLIPYKNHEMIVRAATLLSKKYKFKVHLIGEGNKFYKNKIKQLIISSGVESRFVFHGRLIDYSKIAAISQIGVLCSNEEGLSNSILEYMSLKLPVLATNVGGNPELIKDKHNGFLVEKGNYIDFAKNLEKLILNSELRNKFGVNSYQMIKKKFSFKKTLKQYKNLYKNT